MTCIGGRRGLFLTRRLGLAVAGLGATLLVACPAVAAHPPSSADAGSVLAPIDPSSTAASPPATLGTAALSCLAVLASAAALAASDWRRVAVTATAALLVGLAGETAMHSAHHLDAPAHGERCPVFSASQHLSGLDPERGV